MGLIAIVDLGPVSEELAGLHQQGVGESVGGAISEVLTRGFGVIEELQAELEKLTEELADSEEPDPDLSEQIQDLVMRINEVSAGMDAGCETGASELSALDAITPDMYKTDEAYRVFANTFQQEISACCPVRTGFLRASCGCINMGESIMCYALAPYAQYVEYGTSRMSAQPFFEQAVKQAIEAMKPYLEELSNEAQQNSMSDGRSSANSVVSSASAESPDLAEVISGGIASLVMAFVLGFVMALVDEIMSNFMEIDYDMYVI